jgi:hypothetical protein
MWNMDKVLTMNVETMRQEAADEAVSKLGLLDTSVVPLIVGFLGGQYEGEHPRSICSTYRKNGEQISKEEKKKLGLRSNASLSRQAYSDLTDKGRQKPLVSHEQVLLRAWFSVQRFRSVLRIKEMEFPEEHIEWTYEVLNMICPACAAMDGKKVDRQNIAVLPPQSCVCETANYVFRVQIDWLADID